MTNADIFKEKLVDAASWAVHSEHASQIGRLTVDALRARGVFKRVNLNEIQVEAMIYTFNMVLHKMAEKKALEEE